MSRFSKQCGWFAGSSRIRAAVRLGGVLLAAVLVLATPTGAFAAQGERAAWEGGKPSNDFAKPPGISLEQAANKVRRETGGRVLSATPASKGGQRGYSIRVLLDGKRVKQVFVASEGRSK